MTLHITRKRFALSVAVIGVFLNLLIVLNPLPTFDCFLILTIIMLLPGILIMLSVNKTDLEPKLESLLYIIGLSLAFLMLGGLLINTVGPPSGINRPLGLYPMMVTFDVLAIAFASVAIYRHQHFELKFDETNRLGWIDASFIGFGFICLLLVLGGSQLLNNGGPGTLVMSSLIGLAVYVLLAAQLRNRLKPATFPIAAFLFGLTLLLSYSLRSNYVFGWDVNQEFYVSQIANVAKHWTIIGNHSPYNACLSITILPTVLESIAHVSNNAFFKIVAQAIFALVPLVIFVLANQVIPGTKKDKIFGGFLAAVIFESQTWFITQVPVLVRQEIALFFFGILLISIFGKIKNYRNYSLFFGLMVILSHYSTAYVMLSLFALYILIRFIAFKKHEALFSLNLLLTLLCVTFLWQFQMTRTADNLNQAIKQTLSTLPQVFSSEGIGSSASQVTFSDPVVNTQANNDIAYNTETLSYEHNYHDLYPKESYSQYSPQVIQSLANPGQPLVNGISSTLLLDMGKFTKIIMSDLLPIAGIFTIGYWALFNKRKTMLKNYFLLSSAAIILIFLMLVLPFLKEDYNLTRLWLQTLILFAPLVVIGGTIQLSRFSRYSPHILAGLVVIFFLYSAGVVSYISTGVAPAIFSNDGDFYLYYTTDGEVDSAVWLHKLHTRSPIYADQLAGQKLISQGGIEYTQDYVYPSTLSENSYVYASRTNLEGIEFHKYLGSLLQFQFPNSFLQQQKNSIYNDGDSVIYH